MADLNPLIRVRRHAIEQKQKFLAELYRQVEDLYGQKKKLTETLIRERKKLEELGTQMLGYFGPYSAAVKKRVENIDREAGKLEGRIEVARDSMRESYAELKKIEITQARREAEEAAGLKKKENSDLDETALETFRRKEGD